MVFRSLCFVGVNALVLASLSPEPKEALQEKSDANGPWTIPVLVIRYFPLAADRQTIDINVTSNVGAPLRLIRTKCDRMTRDVVKALQEGSRFHAYKDPKASPSLKYVILNT